MEDLYNQNIIHFFPKDSIDNIIFGFARSVYLLLDTGHLEEFELGRLLNKHVQQDVHSGLQGSILLEQLVVGPLQVDVILQDGVMIAAGPGVNTCSKEL